MRKRSCSICEEISYFLHNKKIKNFKQMKKTHFLLLLFLTILACKTEKENNPNNPYGLDIISDIEVYRQQVNLNPDLELVDVSNEIPGIVLDIRYATDNNFTGKVIYTLPMAFARKKAVECNVNGFVQNNSDGSVYIEASGEAIDVDTFIDWCKQGPTWARVINSRISELPNREWTGFEIK